MKKYEDQKEHGFLLSKHAIRSSHVDRPRVKGIVRRSVNVRFFSQHSPFFAAIPQLASRTSCFGSRKLSGRHLLSNHPLLASFLLWCTFYVWDSESAT